MERNSGIEQILEIFSIEEALEHLDITPEEVLEILYQGGHVTIPDWLEDRILKY